MFVAKIDALAKRYHSMRRTRGDGNCFYRSFVFAYLEWLLMNWDQKECTRCGFPMATNPGCTHHHPALMPTACVAMPALGSV